MLAVTDFSLLSLRPPKWSELDHEPLSEMAGNSAEDPAAYLPSASVRA
jgi:hypothetical protein